MQKLTGESHEDFKSYLRLEPAIFHEILNYTKIKKSKDNRSALPSGLNTTLRFLGTGDSHHSVAWNFHVAHNAISILAPQVCSAIAKYKDVFLLPSTLEAWQTSCNGLLDKMKLPLLLRGHRRKTCHTNRYPAPHITTTMFLIALLRLVHPNDKLLWVNVNMYYFCKEAGIGHGPVGSTMQPHPSSHPTSLQTYVFLNPQCPEWEIRYKYKTHYRFIAVLWMNPKNAKCE